MSRNYNHFSYVDDQTRPEVCDASDKACQIIRRIMKHDGFDATIRRMMRQETGFIAHLCRVVDQELKPR